jgi:two-component system CheB/CheR fusion protein
MEQEKMEFAQTPEQPAAADRQPGELEPAALEPSPESRQPKFVVGVGASAGGLEPLETLFDALPADTGMAFVVVQHLSPDFKSLMDELIRRHTEMAVFRVEDGMLVQANAIYLIPAGKEMIISQGRLLLTDKDPSESLTLPIDHFFRSLAHDCGTRAIAIVLSGSGSDGSRGVREVHNMGGLVIAQDAATAAFDSMPNAAEETGVVDVTAAPDEIAGTLLRLVNHPLQRAATSQDQPPVPEDGIKRILRVIRDTYGIDFTYYKPTTVMRRIERRLLLNHAMNLDAYVETVSRDSEELNLLYKDLLIGVTEFFRDPPAFRLIEDRVLSEALLKIPAGQEVRIWSAGCATGEEAFSLAILVHERLSAMNRPINVRIFATDVHRASLDFASAGIYNKASVERLSSSRLERYFTKTREGYRVSQDLRNMVVFAPHNLIKDAPFTRLDLISCRNLLIYLQPLAQKKALSLFHFSLKTGGTLLLGPSETTGELADEFEVVNAQWRVYRKRRDIRLPPDMRMPTGVAPVASIGAARSGGLRRSTFPIQTLGIPAANADRELVCLYGELLGQFMPASLVVDENNQLVHSFGGVNELLRVPVGRATSNALDLLSPDLRTVVVGAMQRVNKTGQAVTFNRVTINQGDAQRDVRVTVRPILLRPGSASYTLIVLEEGNAAPVAAENVATSIEIDDVARERIDVLETELRFSRESLQATIEELESSNEELQATNEELVASNEELQSTNEELHSVNEELYTVNAEYQKKINELTELTHDMDNLLNSTDVHTLFLDEELCIRKFTPQMGAEFNLIPSDVGRHIDGFSNSISCKNLLEKLGEVISTGKRYEEEISNADRDHFLLRILPYRGETYRSGVVLTLVNVTESREVETRFRGTFENAAVGIAHADLEGRLVRANQRLCDILDFTRAELMNFSLQQLMYPDGMEQERVQFASLKRGEIDRFNLEVQLIRRDRDAVWTSLTVSLERDDDGVPLYAICIVQDISPRKTFESQLSEAITQRDRFLAMLSHELRNPLSAIVNAATLLERQRDGGDDSDRPRQVIRRQSDRVAALLDDLLDVTRVTQGKISLERTACDLNQLVQEALDNLAQLIDKHQHTVRLELCDQPPWVYADGTRVLQIIENLVTNAVKYTPNGGQITAITQIEEGAAQGVPAQAVVRIADTGCGMSQALLSSVFDMFVQSDETLDRSEGGMGVGLTLVRSLVELHGGTIEANSEGADQGSEFVVRLPITELPKQVRQTPQQQAPADSRQRRRLLLVEDNADAREMLQCLLELEGFEVQTADDGLEGLQLLQREEIDTALIDIGLPKLDGYELVRRYRDENSSSRTRLIALTGYGQSCDIERAKQAGFDEHLVKPIDPQELIGVLTATKSDSPVAGSARRSG